MVTPETGTKGQTSVAPIRLWAPLVAAHVDDLGGLADGPEGGLPDGLRGAR